MRIFHANHYYHIYNRGVNRGRIFFQKRNWGFFISKLRQHFDPNLVDILAYCLMPNHYHLLIHIKADHDFGRQTMRPFTISYTKAINRQEKRVGALFQGRFQTSHVDNESYLKNLTRYIHRNPVAAGLVARPDEWPYSSYADYVGLRQGTLPHTSVILNQFESMATYQAYVERHNDDQYQSAEFANYLIDA